jgi:hypothetical protein
MRILIYSETDAAKARRDELRAEGHHASLRNPYYFNPAQFDKACDQVIADDPVILSSYLAAGIAIERLSPEEGEGEFEPLPPADDTEKVSKPKPKPKSKTKAKTDK